MNIREVVSRAFVIISILWVAFIFAVHTPGIFSTVKTLAVGLAILWAAYWAGVWIASVFSSND